MKEKKRKEQKGKSVPVGHRILDAANLSLVGND